MSFRAPIICISGAISLLVVAGIGFVTYGRSWGVKHRTRQVDVSEVVVECFQSGLAPRLMLTPSRVSAYKTALQKVQIPTDRELADSGMYTYSVIFARLWLQTSIGPRVVQVCGQDDFIWQAGGRRVYSWFRSPELTSLLVSDLEGVPGFERTVQALQYPKDEKSW